MVNYALGRFDAARKAYERACDSDSVDKGVAWNGVGCASFALGRFERAREAFERAREFNSLNARLNLVSLYRDFLLRLDEACRKFADARAKVSSELDDSVAIHEALFAAYESNWGVAANRLKRALAIASGSRFHSSRDVWASTAGVLLHLGYGTQYAALLAESGDAEIRRPYYEAVCAHVEGDGAYLRDVPAEVRPTATWYFDSIQRELDLLPEASQRR